MDLIKKKVFLINLGCAKNLVDSENILGILKKEGFLFASTLDDAEIAIINTCGFIQPAVEESIENIFEVIKQKKQGKPEKVIVAGCFVQRYGYKLRREIPEVDGWLGTGEINRIAELLDEETCSHPAFLIGRPTFLANHATPRIQSTPFYSAFLKIAEGCSHKCSFCRIPSLRGSFRSREINSLVIEAEEMAERGVKEINLIAQDTTRYGRDLAGNGCLEDLLERLLSIGGLHWIRIMYSHPLGISDRLLEIMEKEEAICPYLDLPFQHVNNDILKLMGRANNGENPFQLMERIRSINRRISVRTTIMVGFPGETEGAFRELYNFVKTGEFDHLGTFIYSPERGTAAAKFNGAPDREVAEERLDAIMTLQAEISGRKNRQLIDQVIPVLIEGKSKETDLLLRGRTSGMAPDVDGQVLINRGHGIVGEITPVLIKEAHTYDLVGEIVQ